jgi:transposase
LGKPNGVIQPRVEKVGPERFGIVAVDPAKARSKWMFCNFYGKVLVPPSEVEHTKAHLQLAIAQIQEATRQHGIRDHIAAIEMTGTYHLPVKRTFRQAGWETRLVHPFASRHYRLAAHGDNKTDDTDLEAIFRATVNGFGLLEPVWDEVHLTLKLLSRHRRDLVEKRAKLQCQIREYLQRCLPGYSELFAGDNLWKSPVALLVGRRAGTAQAICKAGILGVTRWLHEEKRRFQRRTVEKIVAWSANAAPADPMSPLQCRLWQTLDDDRQNKSQQIEQLEREIAATLVRTPYVLLLSEPGINVVSAGELGGEMGPITHYANAKAITGRAGLFPSRYQSDEVDHADEPLARFRNRRLRAAWLRVAGNLIKCNGHYRGKAHLWKSKGVDPRDIRVRIANRATRPVFQTVSGQQLFHHPCQLDRQYVLDKLLQFHQDHQTPPDQILRDLKRAIDQLPKPAYAMEAAPLKRAYRQSCRPRRKGPEPIGTILVAVLAWLGVTELESTKEPTEAQGPGEP